MIRRALLLLVAGALFVAGGLAWSRCPGPLCPELGAPAAVAGVGSWELEP